VPYCDHHRIAFQRRFRVLRIIQYILIAGFFGCFFTGVSMQENDDDWNYLMILGLMCLLLLPITLIGRHFLYDAFFRFRPGGVLISSKHQKFIENVLEVNQLGQPE
jgi:hypothetical protein